MISLISNTISRWEICISEGRKLGFIEKYERFETESNVVQLLRVSRQVRFEE